MATCPHPDAVQIRNRCYHCIKLAALNGGRPNLSLEQLRFVGFDLAAPPEPGWRPAWTILSMDGTEDESDSTTARGIRYSMRAPGHHDLLEFLA